VRGWFDVLGMAHEGLQLTWDPNAARAAPRRGATCPTSPQLFCQPEIDNLGASIGTQFTGTPVTCDE